MKLEEWEKICPDCKGKGFITEKNYEIGATTKYTCPRCCGDGKFDWLENIFGKNQYRTLPTSPVHGQGFYDTKNAKYYSFYNGNWYDSSGHILNKR